VRVAACRAVARIGTAPAVEALTSVVQDAGVPPAVRAEAIETLGRLGSTEALEQVNQACGDPDRIVARRARIARSRLLHVQAR
jgi:HEAT repeat protein